ncbi:winged helix-turn-helix transcriptional regulator [Rhodovibrionaceae bacterium A322]
MSSYHLALARRSLTDRASVIDLSRETTAIGFSFGWNLYILYFMDISFLVKLTSRAWSLKILALLHDGVPGRQAPLLAASGASRTTFVHSLKHLEDLGLIARNPGHGHPLRPEFLLTPKGQLWAPLASRIDKRVTDDPGAALLRKSWTVPLLAVARQPLVFTDLKRALPPITDRALSQSLRDLTDRAWLARSVKVDLTPPRPYYQAINEGAAINREIGSLS